MHVCVWRKAININWLKYRQARCSVLPGCQLARSLFIPIFPGGHSWVNVKLNDIAVKTPEFHLAEWIGNTCYWWKCTTPPKVEWFQIVLPPRLKPDFINVSDSYIFISYPGDNVTYYFWDAVFNPDSWVCERRTNPNKQRAWLKAYIIKLVQLLFSYGWFHTKSHIFRSMLC